jgi:hypothetical protein
MKQKKQKTKTKRALNLTENIVTKKNLMKSKMAKKKSDIMLSRQIDLFDFITPAIE